MITLRSIDLNNPDEFARIIRHRLDTSQVNFGYAEQFWENNTEESYMEFLRGRQSTHPQNIALVLENDEIIGQIECGPAKAEDCGYINLIYVVPEKRGQGRGRLIVQLAEQHLLAQGFTYARLSSSRTNDANTRFYEACGWRCIGDRPNKPGLILWEKQLA